MKHHWIQALYHQYAKNASMSLLSAPIPVEMLPKDIQPLQTIMALGVKEKGKNLWEFVVRQCAHGGAMVQGRDFDFSFSPVITQPALRAHSMLHQLHLVSVWQLWTREIVFKTI